ncbi:MAG: AtpZ/AtpI family protein [Pseudomonadota bacterium]
MDPERLENLGERIAEAEARRAPPPPKDSKYVQANHAWRMVTELVVGMLIGLGIGWGIDSVAGTTPVFLAIFGLLGFAAGVKTMIRTAGEIGRPRKTEDENGRQA